MMIKACLFLLIANVCVLFKWYDLAWRAGKYGLKEQSKSTKEHNWQLQKMYDTEFYQGELKKIV